MLYLLFVITVITIGTFLFGYHMGALNAPQADICCLTSIPIGAKAFYDLPLCIPMSTTEFAVVTSIFTIGGLFGSLAASKPAQEYGRKGAMLWSTIGAILGPILMASASSMPMLAAGRLVAGFSSGMSVVLTPLFISEIAPKELRGSLGCLTQLSIVFGTLVSQLLGLRLSKSPYWRIILGLAAFLGLIQLVLLFFVIESPNWLVNHKNDVKQAKHTLRKLRGHDNIEAELTEMGVSAGQVLDEEERALLGSENDNASPSSTQEAPASTRSFLFDPKYHQVLKATFILLVGQQFLGATAMVFFSTSIMASSFPSQAASISVYIGIVNLVVTAIASQLIDRTGRKFLLNLSVTGMALSTAGLSVSLFLHWPTISAVCCVVFIAAFAVGAGPIPFLMVSELSPSEVAGIAQSLGLAGNWLGAFLVGTFFPTFKDLLGSWVFLIFTAAALAGLIGLRAYVPETKDKSIEEVWETRRERIE
ncbi:putative MFS glucose transporter [Saitoella complicata NRRL Y-17804]|uniref:Major facilitator superfamily (MFS) profile domain-containing protein n=1 Tax=Saitoella complicata (strain BCRC 22490 / CBS 7301 / JCM 7358 / NBRC 10748 / NRRL Y-17804) TaxID=698492 RepID=A0A0E9NLT6_SAICN|nr:putative MFS glucose transporter [Saitoella complicata NRRL Y-17804]ODQ52758.1 putative MFS glucose transporter [Saitoella complicata NRRL Y-17804]GAO50360.1 hypothetical protein G7K_4487-t1 [Saitoella complicata NRRL Y-17804]